MGRLLHHMSCKMGWDGTATAKAVAKVHLVDSVFSGMGPRPTHPAAVCYVRTCVHVCTCVRVHVCMCVSGSIVLRLFSLVDFGPLCQRHNIPGNSCHCLHVCLHVCLHAYLHVCLHVCLYA